jgi:hypothetical protein
MMVALAGAARAEPFDLHYWYQRTQAAVESLFRGNQTDHEVVAAPPNLDRQMAVVPPRGGSRMPVISPRR